MSEPQWWEAESEFQKGCRKLRTLARRWTTQERWAAVIQTVDEFERLCETVGHWPDWWADMERMRSDARSTMLHEYWMGRLDNTGP